MVDANTRKELSGIPLLKTNAGPRDKEIWVQRLKEEYQALIKVNPNFFLFFYNFSNLINKFVFFFSMFKIIKILVQIGFV